MRESVYSRLAGYDDTSDATIETVVDAATRYLLPVSAGEFTQAIARALDLAAEAGSYDRFREGYYAKYLRSTISDSMETIPAVLAILTLAEGDPERSILWGANFGRVADTLAAMIGGVGGALHGASDIRSLPEGVSAAAAPGTVSRRARRTATAPEAGRGRLEPNPPGWAVTPIITTKGTARRAPAAR